MQIHCKEVYHDCLRLHTTEIKKQTSLMSQWQPEGLKGKQNFTREKLLEREWVEYQPWIPLVSRSAKILVASLI